ncbi:MAG TPA: hypothetical protein VKV79_07815 [Terriglobia bacterium]|nr:hypothetical protein [Terriglobia bacterium]
MKRPGQLTGNLSAKGGGRIKHPVERNQNAVTLRSCLKAGLELLNDILALIQGDLGIPSGLEVRMRRLNFVELAFVKWRSVLRCRWMKLNWNCNPREDTLGVGCAPP